ncbi:hypothetical protein SCHPADRAFT_992718 [Schizopora paradoxa]|uniref:Mid2 domain-containing protein n=1 Tax=Schizopora paradoxa TaxID=27342 RepID=A0A0H2S6C4_9AGAM|nr:hypothetical protein SCHPADRAFT_992718 [Schizopora paradoxa]
MSTTPAPSSTSTSTSLKFYTTTVPSILDSLNSSDEVIDDTDQRVVYNGSWTQNLNDGGVPSGTSHTTIVAGSTVTLNFNGTGIDVIGTADLGGDVIQTLYQIDLNRNASLPRQLTSVSGTQIAIACQTFFSLRNMAPGAHTLEITVTSGVAPRAYTLDSFVVINGDSNGASSVSIGPTANLLGSNATTSASATTTELSSVSSSTFTTSTSESSSALSNTPTADAVPSSTLSAFTDTQTQASTSAASRMSGGKIAGLVVGIFAGVLFIIAIILTLYRWRAIYRRRNPKPDTAPRPLVNERHRSMVSYDFGSRKARYESGMLQPPRYELHQSTSPGPPSDDVIATWANAFDPDIQRVGSYF